MSEPPLADQPIILHYAIVSDPDLRKLELLGFVKGAVKGKTMNVPFTEIVHSLDKQYHDFLRAYGDDDTEAIFMALADLRNVAGCVFLKLKEIRVKPVIRMRRDVR
jgi:hypothetical protein